MRIFSILIITVIICTIPRVVIGQSADPYITLIEGLPSTDAPKFSTEPYKSLKLEELKSEQVGELPDASEFQFPEGYNTAGDHNIMPRCPWPPCPGGKVPDI